MDFLFLRHYMQIYSIQSKSCERCNRMYKVEQLARYYVITLFENNFGVDVSRVRFQKHTFLDYRHLPRIPVYNASGAASATGSGSYSGWRDFRDVALRIPIHRRNPFAQPLPVFSFFIVRRRSGLKLAALYCRYTVIICSSYFFSIRGRARMPLAKETLIFLRNSTHFSSCW